METAAVPFFNIFLLSSWASGSFPIKVLGSFSLSAKRCLEGQALDIN